MKHNAGLALTMLILLVFVGAFALSGCISSRERRAEEHVAIHEEQTSAARAASDEHATHDEAPSTTVTHAVVQLPETLAEAAPETPLALAVASQKPKGKGPSAGRTATIDSTTTTGAVHDVDDKHAASDVEQHEVLEVDAGLVVLDVEKTAPAASCAVAGWMWGAAAVVGLLGLGGGVLRRYLGRGAGG